MAPFSSAAGKLKNVTISGEIRVRTRANAQVHVGTVLGYSLGAELKDARTSLAFSVNGVRVPLENLAPAWEEGVAA